MSELEAMEQAVEPAIMVEELVGTEGLPTGSTLLNLACTGTVNNGFPIGHFTLVVGDRAAGKTLLTINAMAEACLDPRFDGYDLVYDNVENGMMFDLNRMFHSKLAERLEPPAVDETGIPIYSRTVMEFFFHLDARLDSGRPVIYILDSADALTSEADDEKFKDQMKAHNAGKETTGSYGMNKAKEFSQNLRRVTGQGGLRKNGSILIILSQTRDNVDPRSYEKKTRSGGNALGFYSSMELWASLKGKIKKTVNGVEREVGVHSFWRSKKNRSTGLLREVLFDVYPSYGIDDTGSIVDFLVQAGRWSGSSKGRIEAGDFGMKGSRAAIVKKIETEGHRPTLIQIAQEVWTEVEEACKLDRPKRYEE